LHKRVYFGFSKIVISGGTDLFSSIAGMREAAFFPNGGQSGINGGEPGEGAPGTWNGSHSKFF